MCFSLNLKAPLEFHCCRLGNIEIIYGNSIQFYLHSNNICVISCFNESEQNVKEKKKEPERMQRRGEREIK